MTPTRRRRLLFSSILVASGVFAQAHPGHDGHELTWDFRVVAEHPWPAAFGVLFVAMVVWSTRALARAHRGADDQSLRGSQESLGK